MVKLLILSILSILFISGCSTVTKISRSGYEEAPHKVLIKNGNIELRSYSELQLVETSMNPQGEGGFMRLFTYIDRGNSKSQKIAMTTPVYIQKKNNAKTIAFVLPATMNKDEVPAPTGIDVKTETRPSGTYAVYRYSGKRVDGGSNDAKKSLKEWIVKNGYRSLSEPINAYYDTPWTPPFLRRNELMIQVDTDHL
jgi:hypothetical protein